MLSTAALAAGLISLPGAALGAVDEELPPLTLPLESTPGEKAPELEEAPAAAPTGEQPSTPVVEQGPAELELLGSVQRLSSDLHDGGGRISPIRLLTTVEHGFFSVDFSAVQLADLDLRSVRVALRAPEGVAFTGDATADAAALRDFTASSGESIQAAAVRGAATYLGASEKEGEGRVVVDGAIVGFDGAVVGKDQEAPERELAAMVNVAGGSAATHKILAVPVTPGNITGSAAHASQSAANIAAAVDDANKYWSEQISGKVKFTLANGKPTKWYKSAISCDAAVQANFTNLLNEASTAAAAQLGYTPGVNHHLVLFFPAGATGPCNALGLGSVGWSLNEGGALWTTGSSALSEDKRTLWHELGHNLGLGHSDWTDCIVDAPGFPYSAFCNDREYGNAQDTMGRGTTGLTGGAISAPHAIRTALWPAGSSAIAPQGTKRYALKSVSGNKGLRAVVVQDAAGNNFFVEFRNRSDEDSLPGRGCILNDSCLSDQPGVQISLLEYQGSGGYQPAPQAAYRKGFPGDNAHVLGRTVGGVKRVDYRAGETFRSLAPSATGGIIVTVNSITGSGTNQTANVTITRPQNTLVSSGFFITCMVCGTHPTYYQVGDQLQASFDAAWEADSYSFQWYRGGKAIKGATGASYTLVAADYNQQISARVSQAKAGYIAHSATTARTAKVTPGVIPGSLSVPTVTKNATTRLLTAALPAGSVTESGVRVAWQWLRDGKAISKATKASYALTSADAGKALQVRISITKSGFSEVVRTTHARDFSVKTPKPVLGGTVKVGYTINFAAAAGQVQQNTAAGTLVGTGVSRSIQWLRDGKPIAGATAASYLLTPADWGKKLSVRITDVHSSGLYRPSVQTSAAATVGYGVITPGSVNLHVSGASYTATRAGWVASGGALIGYKFQWYYNGKAIKNATGETYTLKSGQVATKLKVKVTGGASCYASASVTKSAV